MTTQKVTVDGITVEMSDTAAQVVAKVQKQLADAQTALDAANAKVGEITAVSSTKDGEIAVLKQQLADATLTPAKLDAAVQARAAVVADAKAIAGEALVVDGKTDAEIRRAAVASKLGDDAKNMDDAAIGGAFRALAKSGTHTDPLRQALATVDASALDDLAKSRNERDQRLTDSWKNAGKVA